MSKKAEKGSEVKHGRKWTFDLAADAKIVPTKGKQSPLAAPFGWVEQFDPKDGAVQKKDAMLAMRSSMAYEIATGQAKSLMMNIFMMWMAGNSIHIVPIMFTCMALSAPITAIMNINTAYAKFHDVDTTLPKLIYIAINLAGLAAGCYKCASLGLLPTKPADWLAADNIKPAMEFSGGGIPLVGGW